MLQLFIINEKEKRFQTTKQITYLSQETTAASNMALQIA